MHVLMAWCGFFGAWLLVVGPVYQASIELEEEEFQNEEFDAVVNAVDRPERVSAWWWLLPPVMYVEERRRHRAYQERVLEAMTPEQVEAFVSFSATSLGWLIVGAGGLLIAVKETWELVEAMEWAEWLVWVLALVMSFLAVLHTVLRVRRNHQVLERRGAAGA